MTKPPTRFTRVPPKSTQNGRGRPPKSGTSLRSVSSAVAVAGAPGAPSAGPIQARIVPWRQRALLHDSRHVHGDHLPRAFRPRPDRGYAIVAAPFLSGVLRLERDLDGGHRHL